MKVKDLIKILEMVPDSEVFVGPCSSTGDVDYTRTSDLKVCDLGNNEIIICDGESTIWKNKFLITKK